MKICYLVNLYPKTSHTFVRREIHAMEALNYEVVRIAIRTHDEVLTIAEDFEEQKKTQVILSGKKFHDMAALILALLQCLPALPRAFGPLKTLIKNSDRGLLIHLVYLLEACWLRNLCKSRGIRHIHAHFGTNPAAVALLCKTLGGPDYSFTVHGPDEFDSPKQLSLGEKVKHAKFAVAISAYGRSQYYRWTDFKDWPKIQVVHCGLSEDFLAREPIPVQNNTQLVCIGRLSPQKGQLTLLEALRILKQRASPICVRLVGDGEYRDYFENYIREHDLANYVQILGWQDSEAIIRELDNAAALVLPSFAEGLPVVIMEAFARARPAICSSIAGIPELVNPHNGWLVAPGEPLQLADAMERLSQTDVATLRTMGLAGRQAVLNRHSAAIEAKKLDNAINNVSE